MGKILVIGSLNMDFVLNVDKMPGPGETVLGNKCTLVPGGKGANQAYAIGKLGGDVSMLGAVGNDQYGDTLIHNLNSVNVDTNNIERLYANTGSAFINVDASGENSIVVIPGANNCLTKEIIDENVSLIEKSDIVVMQLEIPLDIVTYVAKIAKEKNKMVILDPAPARKDLPDELFSCLDIIKPNETELQILSGIYIKTEQDIVTAGRKLIDRGVKTVIATLGANGSMLVTANSYRKFEAYKTKVVDTTAAGDSFTGALAIAIQNGSIEPAIEYAHLVSSIVVTKKGAQTSIPSLDEIEEFKKQMINRGNNYGKNNY